MIKIELKDEVYELRNSLDEITIEEFEIIIYLINKENTFIQKWIEILEFLGLPEYVIDTLDEDSFIEIVKSISNNFAIPNDTVKKSVIIDGEEYLAYKDEKFKLTMKQIKFIQKNILNKESYFSDLCAYIYNKNGNNEIENMDVDHFRYKKLFFRDQKMELIIPILRIINISLAKKFNLLINGVA